MGPRVLQVVLSLNPGGTERLVIDLATRLNEQLPSAICCLDEPGEWAAEVRAKGISVTSLARKPGFHPLLSQGVARAAAEHRASVVHAHHYSPFVYAGLARLWRPGLRVIFTEHGRLSDRGPSAKRRIANQVIGQLASRVATVSEDVKAHLVAEGFSANRVDVIYNGISPAPPAPAALRRDIRARVGAEDHTLVVGTIARLDTVKDLGTLLAAVAELRPSRRVITVVVGDGPERPRLEQLAADFGISSDVRFLGQRSDAREWLAGCDVYVNSSISEGVSLTILEAMSAGLPVVVTGVGGTPEVVDASCGRVVAARAPGAIAHALTELASDPELRATLGDAGRRRVLQRFTLDRMINEYAAVYRALGEAGSA